MAVVYTLYVIGLYFFRGSAPFDAMGVSLGAVILAYFAAGIMGGTVVGALLPLARSRIGATIVGIVAAFFVFLSIAITDAGLPSQWSGDDWIRYVVLSVAMGALGANGIWMVNHSSDKWT